MIRPLHSSGPLRGALYAVAGIVLRAAVPHAYEGLWTPLISLIVMHVARTTFELTACGRITPRDGWLPRAFAMMAVLTVTIALSSGRPTALLGPTLWLGVIVEIDRARWLLRRVWLDSK